MANELEVSLARSFVREGDTSKARNAYQDFFAPQEMGAWLGVEQARWKMATKVAQELSR